MTRTIEEEFDFVCKSAGLVKLGISKKPTWLTADKSEGVELDGTTVRMFNNNNGERDYKDAPGSKLQAIVDAFKAPAPKPESKKTPPKCPICGKNMILTVIDVVDGGHEVGGVPIEGLVCEDEAKHKVITKPAEVVKPKGDEKMESKPEFKEVEIVKDNLPARKTEFKTGTCEAVAVQYGIPSELANLFFMKMNEGLYIKNPGLLYLAGKKGYSRIEITDKYDEKSQEWSAECRIYPKVTKEILEGISKLDKDMQKQAFDFLTNPTNGTGRASKNNVKMSTMQAFLREMAQTRAQNRALRAFTGYGGTSAEELPEGQIEDAKS